MPIKEFSYRGQSTEELKKMDIREFSKYLPARPRRTIMRQFNEIEKFVNDCRKKISMKKQIKTHLRDIVIVPQMIGMRISVYNGKAFSPFEVQGEMLGHRLGEFSLSRSRVHHGAAGIGSTKGTKSRAKK